MKNGKIQSMLIQNSMISRVAASSEILAELRGREALSGAMAPVLRASSSSSLPPDVPSQDVDE
jgi:hypothetical protein